MEIIKTLFIEYTEHITLLNFHQTLHQSFLLHFDLITKFDELDKSLFLENREYRAIAEKYLIKAIECGCIFEVNTGAITRGLRKAPYPSQHLLHVMKDHDVKLMLSSDSHVVDTLDGVFEETCDYLYDLGFRYVYVPSDNGFTPQQLKS